jgi:hypothetical protein
MPTNTVYLGNSVFLSPLLWHCAGVFIGNRGTTWPWQGQLGPQLPGLSLEYSLTGGLLRVITTQFIKDVAQPTLLTW